MRRLLTIIMLLLAPALAARAQQPTDHTRLLLILDCSQSMWSQWQSDSKIKVTQHVLLHFLDSIEGQTDIQVALRVFGHLNNQAIGTRLEVPFSSSNLYTLRSKIKTLVPNGGITADSALSQALTDFPRDPAARNFILIITDGLDRTLQRLCHITAQMQQHNSVVQTFIIGIDTPDTLASTPGCPARVIPMPSEEHFAQTLHHIFRLSDEKARVVLTLLDADHTPYQTDLPVTFTDSRTHTHRLTTIHHYSPDTPPDTLLLDPLAAYDITLHTKPPVRLANRRFAPAQLTLLPIPAPQGTLSLHFAKGRTPYTLPPYTILVRRHDDPATLATQPLDASAHYLAGNYDIEILTLPPTHLRNIAVRSGANTSLELPLPGQLALDKPQEATLGSIFACKADGLQWVCDLDPTAPTERIILMPGEYQVVLRPANAPTHAAVRSARFTIHSAQQTGLKAQALR